MTRHRFFVASKVRPAATGELDEVRSRQVSNVLRLKPGDEIVVFDGSGAEGFARLTSVSKSTATFRIDTVSSPDREPPIDLTVGLALLRGDRFEIALQKLTEIGVRKIVPLEADRCVVSFRDARDWDKRAARYQRIIVEAMEQSERVTATELTPPATVDAFLSAQPTIGLVEREAGQCLADISLTSGSLAIAVGPEGGWSDREFNRITDRAERASLGGLILRAETAAIVAAGAIVQQQYSSQHDKRKQGETQRGS